MVPSARIGRTRGGVGDNVVVYLWDNDQPGGGREGYRQVVVPASNTTLGALGLTDPGFWMEPRGTARLEKSVPDDDVEECPWE